MAANLKDVLPLADGFIPDSKVRVANMGPPRSWRPQVGPALPTSILLSGMRHARMLSLSQTNVTLTAHVSTELKLGKDLRSVISIYYLWPFRCDSTEVHYNDAMSVSNQPDSQLFTQPFIRAQIKENIKISESLAFVGLIHRSPVKFPHKGPATQEMFPFDDVMCLLMWQLGWDGRVLCAEKEPFQSMLI